MTFVTKFGSFSYRVMSFELKNALVVFSRIFVKAFREYIYKTMAIHFDDWTVYTLLKDQYIQWIILMIERCK